MNYLFCACVVLCIFYLRDVFVLGSTREPVRWKLVLYSLATYVYLVTAMKMARRLPQGRALELLGSPWIWMATLVIHAGLWRMAVWFKHRPVRDGMWVIALLPAPMLILAMLAASYQFAETIGVSHSFTSGVTASALWIGFVLISVAGFRLAYRGWKDHAFVADLAEIASWTGLGILPFTGVLGMAG